ncbi:hypothetical protein EDB84DRAFT_1558800 [Lactarius hengduanensis]|nr:hypothetical protein EDB84DRAFT_1558800 [Lactarius hengduanensis]
MNTGDASTGAVPSADTAGNTGNSTSGTSTSTAYTIYEKLRRRYEQAGLHARVLLIKEAFIIRLKYHTPFVVKQLWEMIVKIVEFGTLNPYKLATAFQGIEDEAPHSPLSPTATTSSGGGIFSELLAMSDSVPFVVSEALSKAYYKSLPSQPRLIATTSPDPFKEPGAPAAYSVHKELRELGNHPLASFWDHGLSDSLRHGLNKMDVNWTSIDALRIVEVGEPSGPAIVWIGVQFGALSFEEGGVVALQCRRFIDSYGVHNYHVEIRESHVMRQAGNRFFDPVPSTDPTFTARDPYTATHGIPISTKRRPWVEGTGGFYLSAGGDDKNIYLVTARHVVLPIDKDDNKEYERRKTSKAREDVLILGTAGFREKLNAIDYDIQAQKDAIADAKEGIMSVDDSVRKKAEQDLQEAEDGLKDLGALHHEISTQWGAKEKRIIGELVWAPPIVLSTEPDQYTLDLAIIKIDAGKLDASNYRGNSINIGTKYTRQQFMEKVYLNPTSSTSFKFPASDHIVTLKGQVPENALFKPPMLDDKGEQCLVVFKNGAKTGTTIGKANNVSSYTRTYWVGQYQESREWPVIPTDKHSGKFSEKGDSGSCVADTFGRVGGILTGGTGNPNVTDSADVTYVTPISFIMKVLHSTKRFKHAHLNPTLA